MFNTENCKLITTAYRITFVERAEYFSSSDFARMYKVLNKNTENNVSKILMSMQQTNR